MFLWKKTRKSPLSRKRKFYPIECSGDIPSFYRFVTYGPPCISLIAIASASLEIRSLHLYVLIASDIDRLIYLYIKQESRILD